MKTGKVSQAILDRSVLRPLSRAGVLPEQGGRFGEDCGVWKIYENSEQPKKSSEEEQKVVCACAGGTLNGAFDRTVEMLLAAGVNNLACAGAEAFAVTLTIMIPEIQEERALKEILETAGAWCAKQKLTVVGGHTEVSSAVARPVLSVTVLGRGREEALSCTANLRPNQDLVMVGWTGLAGTVILAKNHEKRLAERYPFSILDAAKGLEEFLLITDAARAGRDFEVSAMHDVSQGGIFAALWEMAECACVGLEIDLKRIPIRQETVEICEFFQLNPYQLYGQGALLIGTDRGEALTEQLQKMGIPAAVIGQTTDGNDRLIRNGEEVRFLDRPAQDSLWLAEHDWKAQNGKNFLKIQNCEVSERNFCG